MNSGSRERKQRVDVLRDNKMPRRSHDVRAQYRSIIKSSLDFGTRSSMHAQSQRPLGGREILCLYRAQPGHHFGGLFTFLIAEQLI